MTKLFFITCERQVTERVTLSFDAPTLADAFHMAARAYYRWDDCQVSVEELSFEARGTNDEFLASIPSGEAKEITTEVLRAYGVVE